MHYTVYYISYYEFTSYSYFLWRLDIFGGGDDDDGGIFSTSSTKRSTLSTPKAKATPPPTKVVEVNLFS